MRGDLRLFHHVLVAAAALGLASCGSSSAPGASGTASLDQQVRDLKVQLSALAQNAFSGGGVNIKMMPDPATGKPSVPLEEDFSFNRSYAICRVPTNPQAFAMPTYSMGTVTIQPHSFFMDMEATKIDEVVISTLNNGDREVRMRGGLSCYTEVGQTTLHVGSRTLAEHATYEITAIDSGVGGGQAGDSFAFKVFFNKAEAPVNYAMFGPEATFTGQMIAGEINIIDPSNPSTLSK